MAGDKSAAFIKAWAIVKAGTIEIAVNGVSFGMRQEALRRLAKYEPAQIKTVLVPEPENKHDSEAIAVKVGINGGRGIYTIGYIPRTFTAVVKAIGANFPSLHVLTGDINGARLALAV
jgi:hypothetical protein